MVKILNFCWRLNLILCLSCFPLAFAAINQVNAHQGTAVTCPRLWNSVTVDGRWTDNDEWSDSSETSMFAYPKKGQFPAEAYFRTKHDDQYLYLLWDFPTDTALGFNTGTGYGDEAYMIVDPKNDGSLAPKNDDFIVLLKWLKGGKFEISKSDYDGERWRSAYAEAILGNSSLSQSAYSSKPHAIYECAIPMEYFLNLTTVGFASFVYDSQKAPYTEMLYPNEFDYNAPRSWADLTFSSIVIPEFPIGFASVILTVSICAVLLVASKRRINFKSTVP